MMINWYSDFKWCIENDFQVYVKPMHNTGHCKIAIRKGGISTEGKDSKYCKKTGLTIYSKENLGSVTYKNQILAMEKLPSVYEYLRKKYNK